MSNLIEGDANSFERQPSEPNRAYHAFCLYRSMGVSRSIDKAYCQAKGLQTGSKKASGCFVSWSRDYQWRERAESYDAHMEREGRKAEAVTYLADLESFRQRQKNLGRAALASAVNLFNKANARLSALEDAQITPGILSSMFRAAAAVATAATNAEAQSLGVEAVLRSLENDLE